jgi:hypothetical protein
MESVRSAHINWALRMPPWKMSRCRTAPHASEGGTLMRVLLPQLASFCMRLAHNVQCCIEIIVHVY